jgi:hypothetical protein
MRQHRAYRSSLVCRHWHGHPGLVAVLHRALYSINPFQYVDLISGLSSFENQHLWLIVELFSSFRWRNVYWSYIIDLGCGLQYSVALIIVGIAFNFGNNCVGSVVWRPSDWAPGIASWGRLLLLKCNISCPYTSKLIVKPDDLPGFRCL